MVGRWTAWSSGRVEPHPRSTRPGTPASGRLATFLAAAFGPLTIWAVTVGLGGLLASPDLPPGRCEGIGFGCSLPKRDAVWLVGLYLGVPVVAVATLVTLLALAVPERRRRAVVTTLLALFAAGTVVVVVGLAVPD